MLAVDSWSPEGGTNLLKQSGAFLWWYLDLINEEGDGIVLIWSYGLPFIPGYEQSALPEEKPSINLAVYQGFKLISYTLHELPPQEVQWEPEHSRWQFGDSTLWWEQTSDGDRFCATFNLSVPGSLDSIRGRAEVLGKRRRAPRAFEQEPPHLWCPTLAGTQGEVELFHGENQLLKMRGRAYLDHNRSSSPIDQLGIGVWHWGRLPFENQDLIYYLAEPTAESDEPVLFLGTLGASGEFQELSIESIHYGEMESNFYGLSFPKTMHILCRDKECFDINFRTCVDEGPFYLRFMISAMRHSDKAQALGTAELVCPPQINRRWHQPFVRMRIQREPYENSMWVPLFCGPLYNRLKRLFRLWFSPPGERSS